MIRFTYRRGLVFVEGQMRWTLERMLVTGKYQFISDAGEIQNLFRDEIQLKWLAGEWVIDERCLGSLANATYLATPRDLASFTPKQQKNALRKLGYIQALDPEKNPYNAERWKEQIAAHAESVGDKTPPAPSSVQNWWRRFRVTKSVTALVARHRGRNVPHETQAFKLFEEAVATVFLTIQKMPCSAVVELVGKHVSAFNSTCPEGERIECPARSTIYRWLKQLRQDLVDSARLGAEVARSKYRMAMGGLKVANLLERLEIDHTPIDLIVVDGLTGISMGRPWLSMAIDKASRMPMGFYIGCNAPSSYSVLQCLRRSILPKSEWLARFPDVRGKWPAEGIPDLIAIDNGMDLHSEALQKACEELGIQMLFCGAKTPEHKGSIERFFRTLNDGLIHRLPGTVFSSVDQRGDYPAEELACITLEDLVHLVTKWIVDIYIVTSHRGIGMSPLDKWFELSSKRLIELPLYPQQLEVITGIPARRTLFHYGLELEGLHYNCRQLQELRRRSGQNLQLELKFYEDTVEYVHVFDPGAKEYLRVPAVDEEYAKRLPRPIHRLIREAAKKRFGSTPTSLQLLEARGEVEAIVKRAIANQKAVIRKRAGAVLLHDSEAVLAERDPLAEARMPLSDTLKQVPSPLMPGLDDVLPELTAFDSEGGV